MNTTVAEGVQLAKDINAKTSELCDCVGVVIAPPFTHLSQVAKAIDGDRICLAAQNCATESNGAYTGEVAVDMLKEVGCKAVIIGHSERRSYYKECNKTLNKKVKITLEADLRPIYCCGELLEEREAGKLFDVVKAQISEGLFDLSEEDFRKVIVAYEPVWAIGTGVVASPEQAQEMHKFIRDLIAGKYGQKVADDTTLLYGGSCKPANAKELFANPDVDGGLIGGASLKADDFIAIGQSFKCDDKKEDCC